MTAKLRSGVLRTRLLGVAAVFTLGSTIAFAARYPESFDARFGVGGTVLFDSVKTSGAGVWTIAQDRVLVHVQTTAAVGPVVDPNGVAGLWQLRSNGVPDDSFGRDGHVMASEHCTSPCAIRAALPIAPYIYVIEGSKDNAARNVSRLGGANGAVDTTWGASGSARGLEWGVKSRIVSARLLSCAKILKRMFESMEALMKRKIEVSVGSLSQALDRFERVWKESEKKAPRRAQIRLTFESLPVLLKNLTPARWTLLETVKRSGPLSINELARVLGRNYKNVHTDVTKLAELGLIERREDQRIGVVWDMIRAEMHLVTCNSQIGTA